MEENAGVSPQQTITEKLEALFRCNICEREFFNKRSLGAHVKTHRNVKQEADMYTCEKCGKVAKTKQALERHAAYHESDRPYSCDVCQQRFKNTDDRGKHYRRLKRDGKFEFACHVCHKHFKSNILLQKHLIMLGCEKNKPKRDVETIEINNESPDMKTSKTEEINSGQINCTCKICETEFTCTDSLKKHYKNAHSDSKRQVCIQCGQTLSSKDSLARHYSIFHQTDYPYHCDACDQKFKIKEALCRHVKFVHKDGGYPCGVCQRVFSQPVNLKKHMAIHSTRKEFGCSICGREFRWKQALQKHALLHAADKKDGYQDDGHNWNKSIKRKITDKMEDHEEDTDLKPDFLASDLEDGFDGFESGVEVKDSEVNIKESVSGTRKHCRRNSIRHKGNGSKNSKRSRHRECGISNENIRSIKLKVRKTNENDMELDVRKQKWAIDMKPDNVDADIDMSDKDSEHDDDDDSVRDDDEIIETDEINDTTEVKSKNEKKKDCSKDRNGFDDTVLKPKARKRKQLSQFRLPRVIEELKKRKQERRDKLETQKADLSVNFQGGTHCQENVLKVQNAIMDGNTKSKAYKHINENNLSGTQEVSIKRSKTSKSPEDKNREIDFLRSDSPTSHFVSCSQITSTSCVSPRSTWTFRVSSEPTLISSASPQSISASRSSPHLTVTTREIPEVTLTCGASLQLTSASNSQHYSASDIDLQISEDTVDYQGEDTSGQDVSCQGEDNSVSDHDVAYQGRDTSDVVDQGKDNSVTNVTDQGKDNSLVADQGKDNSGPDIGNQGKDNSGLYIAFSGKDNSGPNVPYQEEDNLRPNVASQGEDNSDVHSEETASDNLLSDTGSFKCITIPIYQKKSLGNASFKPSSIRNMMRPVTNTRSGVVDTATSALYSKKSSFTVNTQINLHNPFIIPDSLHASKSMSMSRNMQETLTGNTKQCSAALNETSSLKTATNKLTVPASFSLTENGKFSLVKHMLSLQNEDNFDKTLFDNPFYNRPSHIKDFTKMAEMHKIMENTGNDTVERYDLSGKQNIPFQWLGLSTGSNKAMMRKSKINTEQNKVSPKTVTDSGMLPETLKLNAVRSQNYIIAKNGFKQNYSERIKDAHEQAEDCTSVTNQNNLNNDSENFISYSGLAARKSVKSSDTGDQQQIKCNSIFNRKRTFSENDVNAPSRIRSDFISNKTALVEGEITDNRKATGMPMSDLKESESTIPMVELSTRSNKTDSAYIRSSSVSFDPNLPVTMCLQNTRQRRYTVASGDEFEFNMPQNYTMSCNDKLKVPSNGNSDENSRSLPTDYYENSQAKLHHNIDETGIDIHRHNKSQKIDTSHNKSLHISHSHDKPSDINYLYNEEAEISRRQTLPPYLDKQLVSNEMRDVSYTPTSLTDLGKLSQLHNQPLNEVGEKKNKSMPPYRSASYETDLFLQQAGRGVGFQAIRHLVKHSQQNRPSVSDNLVKTTYSSVFRNPFETDTSSLKIKTDDKGQAFDHAQNKGPKHRHSFPELGAHLDRNHLLNLHNISSTASSWAPSTLSSSSMIVSSQTTDRSTSNEPASVWSKSLTSATSTMLWSATASVTHSSSSLSSETTTSVHSPDRFTVNNRHDAALGPNAHRMHNPDIDHFQFDGNQQSRLKTTAASASYTKSVAQAENTITACGSHHVPGRIQQGLPVHDISIVDILRSTGDKGQEHEHVVHLLNFFN